MTYFINELFRIPWGRFLSIYEFKFLMAARVVFSFLYLNLVKSTKCRIEELKARFQVKDVCNFRIHFYPLHCQNFGHPHHLTTISDFGQTLVLQTIYTQTIFRNEGGNSVLVSSYECPEAKYHSIRTGLDSYSKSFLIILYYACESLIPFV